MSDHEFDKALESLRALVSKYHRAAEGLFLSAVLPIILRNTKGKLDELVMMADVAVIAEKHDAHPLGEVSGREFALAAFAPELLTHVRKLCGEELFGRILGYELRKNPLNTATCGAVAIEAVRGADGVLRDVDGNEVKLPTSPTARRANTH